MIKIREEGPDPCTWPGDVTTIRIRPREATEYMDENGIKYVSADQARAMLKRVHLPCPYGSKKDGEESSKDHTV